MGAARHRGENGISFGTHGEAVAGVFDIAAYEHAAIDILYGGAHAKVRVRRVRRGSNLARLEKQLLHDALGTWSSVTR